MSKGHRKRSCSRSNSLAAFNQSYREQRHGTAAFVARPSKPKTSKRIKVEGNQEQNDLSNEIKFCESIERPTPFTEGSAMDAEISCKNAICDESEREATLRAIALLGKLSMPLERAVQHNLLLKLARDAAVALECTTLPDGSIMSSFPVKQSYKDRLKALKMPQTKIDAFDRIVTGMIQQQMTKQLGSRAASIDDDSQATLTFEKDCDEPRRSTESGSFASHPALPIAHKCTPSSCILDSAYASSPVAESDLRPCCPSPMATSAGTQLVRTSHGSDVSAMHAMLQDPWQDTKRTPHDHQMAARRTKSSIEKIAGANSSPPERRKRLLKYFSKVYTLFEFHTEHVWKFHYDMWTASDGELGIVHAQANKVWTASLRQEQKEEWKKQRRKFKNKSNVEDVLSFSVGYDIILKQGLLSKIVRFHPKVFHGSCTSQVSSNSDEEASELKQAPLKKEGRILPRKRSINSGQESSDSTDTSSSESQPSRLNSQKSLEPFSPSTRASRSRPVPPTNPPAEELSSSKTSAAEKNIENRQKTELSSDFSIWRQGLAANSQLPKKPPPSSIPQGPSHCGAKVESRHEDKGESRRRRKSALSNSSVVDHTEPKVPPVGTPALRTDSDSLQTKANTTPQIGNDQTENSHILFHHDVDHNQGFVQQTTGRTLLHVPLVDNRPVENTTIPESSRQQISQALSGGTQPAMPLDENAKPGTFHPSDPKLSPRRIESGLSAVQNLTHIDGLIGVQLRSKACWVEIPKKFWPPQAWAFYMMNTPDTPSIDCRELTYTNLQKVSEASYPKSNMGQTPILKHGNRYVITAEFLYGELPYLRPISINRTFLVAEPAPPQSSVFTWESTQFNLAEESVVRKLDEAFQDSPYKKYCPRLRHESTGTRDQYVITFAWNYAPRLLRFYVQLESVAGNLLDACFRPYDFSTECKLCYRRDFQHRNGCCRDLNTRVRNFDLCRDSRLRSDR